MRIILFVYWMRVPLRIATTTIYFGTTTKAEDTEDEEKGEKNARALLFYNIY